MKTTSNKRVTERVWQTPMMLLAMAFTALAAPAIADGATQKAPPETGPVQHVLVIAGINRDPQEIRDKAQAVQRLHRYFSETENTEVSVFTAPESPVAHLGTASTRANILNALESLAENVRAEDRVVLYYVGQANLVGETLRLNLPGPDLTHGAFAAALAPLDQTEMVAVLDCPHAGIAVKNLTGPNRIVIAAARSDQPHSTRFSRYFVPALGSPEGDIDGDGRTSVLEAFQWTAQQIDRLYRDQGLLKNETPILEDDLDGEPSQSPWRHAATGKDGARAATCYLAHFPETGERSPTKTAAHNPTGGEDDETLP